MTTQQSRSARHEVQRKQKHRQLGFFSNWSKKKIILTILCIVMAPFVIGLGVFLFYASSTPEISLANLQGAIETKIYDKDQQLIYELGGENREEITQEDVPEMLKDAVTSIEDKRFYSHMGIDPIRIIGAFLNNLSNDSTQGGSTLTQQLVKLSVFSTKEEDQTYERKAQEAVLALKIEREYTKDQILTFYLNKVYMANGQYGFGTASQYYYNKPLSELSLAQTALLAGLPQAPNSYDPYMHPQAAQERRDLVLQEMLQNKKISQSDYEVALATPVSDGLIEHSEAAQASDDALVYDSFISIVINEVQEKTGLDVYNDGLTIETTIDSGAQKELYNIVNTHDYVDYYDDSIQSAVTLLDTHTGAIRAINGGRHQTTLLGYNRAIQENRSSGSTIKPIIDYAPAIEYLEYSTGETLVDKPTTYSSGMTLNNWDYSYMGSLTLREALYLSRNTTALQLFQEVGANKINEFIKQMDINVVNDGENYLVESNSIGVNTSTLKLAAAYAAFSNYGKYSKPYTVTKVTTRDGEVYELTTEQKHVMSDATAYMITDILKDSFTNGFTTNIALSNVYQAGKTGSSNYTDEQKVAINAVGENVIPDSWMAGYSTDYAIAVWVGYDDPFVEGHGVGPNEQTYAKLIYYYLMRYLYANSVSDDWVEPDSVESAVIEKGTSPLKLASSNTPYNRRSSELFLVGTSPSVVSTAYDRIELPAPTGLNAVYDALSKKLEVSWNAYSTTVVSGTPTYAVSVNGQTQTVSNGTKATFENVTGESATVSVTAMINNHTSNAATITLQLPNSSSSSSNSTSSSSESSSSSEGASSSSQSSSSENNQ